jgi:hypothetical protein
MSFSSAKPRPTRYSILTVYVRRKMRIVFAVRCGNEGSYNGNLELAGPSRASKPHAGRTDPTCAILQTMRPQTDFTQPTRCWSRVPKTNHLLVLIYICFCFTRGAGSRRNSSYILYSLLQSLSAREGAMADRDKMAKYRTEIQQVRALSYTTSLYTQDVFA